MRVDSSYRLSCTAARRGQGSAVLTFPWKREDFIVLKIDPSWDGDWAAASPSANHALTMASLPSPMFWDWPGIQEQESQQGSRVKWERGGISRLLVCIPLGNILKPPFMFFSWYHSAHKLETWLYCEDEEIVVEITRDMKYLAKHLQALFS